MPDRKILTNSSLLQKAAAGPESPVGCEITKSHLDAFCALPTTSRNFVTTADIADGS